MKKNKIFSRLKEIYQTDISVNHDQVLFKTKKILLYQILLITIIIGSIVILIGFIEAMVLKQFLLAGCYPLIYLPLILIKIHYKKLSYKFSISIILFCTYLIGIINLIIFSINGAAIPIFLLLLVLTTIFLGLKYSLIALFVCAVSMIITSFLYLTNVISLRIELTDISTSMISWLTAISVLVFLGTIIMLSYSIIQSKMLRSHEISLSQARELRKLNLQQKEDLRILKIAQQQLKISNSNFQDVVSNISTVIWKADITANRSFDNIYISEAADSMMGLKLGTTDNNWDILFNHVKPEYKTQLSKEINRAISRPGILISKEFEAVKADGQIAWLQLKTRCSESQGKLRMFGTISDITRRKLVEIEFQKYRENLENQVIERTKELENQKNDLLELNRVFVGREFRIKELRDELKALKAKMEKNVLS